MKRKVLILDNREEGFEMEKKAFAREGVELLFYSCNNEAELINVARDAYAIIFTSSKIPEKVINQLTSCRALIRYGVGLDNVDIKAASARGIFVSNAPDYGTHSVAEHALALLLNVNRKLTLFDKNIRNNVWDPVSLYPVHSLENKILGIAGFGKTGRAVSKMAAGFGMKMIAFDPYTDVNETFEPHVELVSFDQLVEESDHITLHVPLNNGTKHLFNKEVFRRMKNSTTIINTSRGGLINQNDLIEAMKSGKIAGAGLDVFEDEPIGPDNELLKMNNVVLTPHVAWYTEESIKNLHREVIDEALRILRGDAPLKAVNFAEILKPES